MNRKTWFALAALIMVVLGGWLTASFGPGSTGRTPVLPATTTSVDPAITGTPRTTSAPSPTPAGGRSTESPIDPESGLPWISPAELPPEAHDVLRRINAGGPFTHAKDGSTFGNFEGLLPAEPRGYYKEYTWTHRALETVAHGES